MIISLICGIFVLNMISSRYTVFYSTWVFLLLNWMKKDADSVFSMMLLWICVSVPPRGLPQRILLTPIPKWNWPALLKTYGEETRQPPDRQEYLYKNVRSGPLLELADIVEAGGGRKTRQEFIRPPGHSRLYGL